MGISDFLPWAVAMFATGLFAGLLAGLLGVGGGIVIVPVLYQIMEIFSVASDVRMHLAVGTSLAVIIPTSMMSAYSHFKRRSVSLELLYRWGPGLLIGVIFGAALASIVSGDVLTLIFAIVALLVAIYMLLCPEGFVLRDGLPSAGGRTTISLIIGTISALMGIGGGTLSVPVLSMFGFPIRKAVGTAAAIGTIIAIPGTLGFIYAGLGVPQRPPFSCGYVNLIGLALIFPMTFAMAPVGANLAHAIPPKLLRFAFGAFLCLTSVRMFVGL